MRKIILTALIAAAMPTFALAQGTREKSRLETECSQKPGSDACVQLRRGTSPTTTGTIPGPSNPNRPGEGGSSEGVSGAGAGGVTPGGNPANAGGSPQSSQ